MIAKLGIGTVQFGLDYGISNQGGITLPSEVATILLQAKKNDIFMLDTASAYGSSEQVLGELGVSDFKVVSKFQPLKTENELKWQLETTLKSLRLRSLYGYLAHQADVLIEHPNLWAGLQHLKEAALVQKIGLSLYHPAQLEKLWQLKMVPDLVQLPYNLLDRKFEPYFNQLKSEGTEIHTRSVFLQGLFFLKENELVGKVSGLKKALISLKELGSVYKFSIEELAINFAIHNPEIDHVIVGVNNVQQLKSNIDFIKATWNKDVDEKIRQIKVEDEKLLNPVNWK